MCRIIISLFIGAVIVGEFYILVTAVELIPDSPFPATAAHHFASLLCSAQLHLRLGRGQDDH